MPLPAVVRAVWMLSRHGETTWEALAMCESAVLATDSTTLPTDSAALVTGRCVLVSKSATPGKKSSSSSGASQKDPSLRSSAHSTFESLSEVVAEHLQAKAVYMPCSG